MEERKLFWNLNQFSSSEQMKNEKSEDEKNVDNKVFAAEMTEWDWELRTLI